jgi:hypothetical protein
MTNKLKIPADLRKKLIDLKRNKNISLEGNILKLIDYDNDEDFKNYINTCIESDKEHRKKRLELTKTLQLQNKELIEAQSENEELVKEIKKALHTAEESKENALNELDVIQKRQQTKLISTIVKIALFVIMGVGIITTLMYVFSLVIGKDTQIIGSTWANMFGILLTNAFSIVGTIMGVKYASNSGDE